MITFREQIELIVYFLLFGMFLAVMYDLLNFYLIKFNVKLVVGYIIQFLFWIGLVCLVCFYTLKVSEGYLTIYTFGFFLLGSLIHIYFFSKNFSIDIERLDKWVTKVFLKIRKTIIIIIFPKEVFNVIKKTIPTKKTFIIIFRYLKKAFRNMKKICRKKNRNKEKENEENTYIINTSDGNTAL